MTHLDIAMIAIIALSTVLGIVRGLIKEIVSLLTWVVAFGIALRFGHTLAARMEGLIEYEETRLVAAFAVLFFAALLIGMLVASLIVRLVRASEASGPDRALGALFGMLRGALLVGVLVLIAAVTPLHESQAWTDSRLIGHFETLAHWGWDAVRESGMELPALGTTTSPSAPRED
ncbi:MAG: CvpA family protein [Chromatiales bacterium]|jgi:membrane protein required for colicin V production|nr:CvpA family protein [Chromatiales bacterium]